MLQLSLSSFPSLPLWAMGDKLYLSISLGELSAFGNMLNLHEIEGTHLCYIYLSLKSKGRRCIISLIWSYYDYSL